MRDGKPGLADYVSCVAASTSLGMTKLGDPQVIVAVDLGNTPLRFDPVAYPDPFAFLRRNRVPIWSTSDDGLQRKVRIEMIGSEPIAVE